jgi:hypothetical protein
MKTLLLVVVDNDAAVDIAVDIGCCSYCERLIPSTMALDGST